jgi:hypothetical protein
VTALQHPLDDMFADWGDIRYFTVRLAGDKRLSELLTHLYVLLPGLDDDKHDWVGDDEVDKLVRHGEGWLASHPEREVIASRYLRHQRSLARQALEQLMAEDVPQPDEVAAVHAGEEAAEPDVFHPVGEAMKSGRPTGAPDGDEVRVLDGPEGARLQRDQRLRTARCRDELDVQRIRGVHLDDSAQIPCLQAMLRKVAHQNHGIERLETHHLLGNSVTNLGGCPGAATIQTVSTANSTPVPCLSVPETMYFWPCAVASPGIAVSCSASQRS